MVFGPLSARCSSITALIHHQSDGRRALVRTRSSTDTYDIGACRCSVASSLGGNLQCRVRGTAAWRDATRRKRAAYSLWQPGGTG